MSDRLEVKRFSTLPEAELAVGLLRDHGIDAAVADREMANSAPHLQIALGGIRVTAPDDQLARARDILVRVERRAFDADPEGAEWMVGATPGRVGELDEGEVHGVLGSMATVARIVIIAFLVTPLVMCVGARLL